MYNKHGLAMDSFEREYRSMNGKPVPYKFLGYDSLYDLLVAIPDVVNVMPVTEVSSFLLLFLMGKLHMWQKWLEIKETMWRVSTEELLHSYLNVGRSEKETGFSRFITFR